MTWFMNALPGGLVPPEGISWQLEPISPEEAAEEWDKNGMSAIGHADTAAILSGIVGRTIPAARVTVPLLRHRAMAVVALYQGPRLPEGSTVLPEGAELRIYRLWVFRL